MAQTPGQDGDPGDDEEQVSWLAATAGMPVVASDGAELGHVVEVSGLPEDDIFHGIVFKAGLRGTARLAPASDVRRITARAVYLSVDGAAAERYEER